MPPLPDPGCPLADLWPGEEARRWLASALSEAPVYRGDLTGRRGSADGSGSAGLQLLQLGSRCLKTGPKRWFVDRGAGRRALAALAADKARLGEWRCPETALFLSPGSEDEACWLWTLSPWLLTLGARLQDAADRRDEEARATALERFAEVAARAVVRAAVEALWVDVHPSNFGTGGELDGALRYLDDDVGHGRDLGLLGHSVLRRVDETAGSSPVAADRYVGRLVESLRESVTADHLRVTGFVEAVEQAHVVSPAGERARDRLLAVLRLRLRGRG